jgi:transposase InsO family protein
MKCGSAISSTYTPSTKTSAERGDCDGCRAFTRCIRGWELSRNLDASLSLSALRKALCQGKPKIHHSDQGVQYACGEYTTVLNDGAVKISMADVGQAWQNGYAERFMGTVEDEEVSLSDYEDFHDAYNHAWRVGSSMTCTCDSTSIHRWADRRADRPNSNSSGMSNSYRVCPLRALRTGVFVSSYFTKDSC